LNPAEIEAKMIRFAQATTMVTSATTVNSLFRLAEKVHIIDKYFLDEAADRM
jgi:hypothetical protein